MYFLWSSVYLIIQLILFIFGYLCLFHHFYRFTTFKNTENYIS